MFIRSTWNELLKIAARPRSYIGIGIITLIVAIILFAMYSDGMSFMSFVTSPFEQSLSFEGNILNGNLIAFLIMQMLIIHVPLLIALVTGDLVSGEGAMGTMRLLITRPISRTSLFFSKFAAGCLYTFFILLWLEFLAIAVGRWIFGEGDLIVLNSSGIAILQASDVAWRFAMGFSLAFLSLIMIATLSLCFSCFSDNSIGPIVTTMGMIILFTVIGTLDVQVFDNIRPYLFTTHMAAWRYCFDDPLEKGEIIKSVIVLLVHIVVLLGVAVYKFNRKDILS